MSAQKQRDQSKEQDEISPTNNNNKNTMYTTTDLPQSAMDLPSETLVAHPLLRAWLNRRSQAETNALFIAARHRGGFPMIGQTPQGLGRWEYLERGVDDTHAHVLGYDGPEAVEMAREEGLLSRGIGPNAGPMAVWYPLQDFLNPSEEPDGDGRWAFHTQDDRDTARLNFGNQEHYGLLGVDQPSAQQIWNLRQRLQNDVADGELEEDPTEDINLVWIPEDDEAIAAARLLVEMAAALASPSSSGSSSGEAPTVRVQGHNIGNVDPNSGLIHDPTNRGENNQTGSSAQYHTRRINGKIFTLDRSRAHHNQPQGTETHKSWIVTKDGKWEQYTQINSINWTSKNSVEKINKWKEQLLTRLGWPKKRQETRDVYGEAEKDWLFEKIKANNGQRPPGGLTPLTKEFNAKFPGQDRNESGIQGILERLRKEYREYGGQRKPKKGKGDKKKDEKEKRK